MTLVVEDGTGVTGAESYAPVDAALAYWTARPQSPLAFPWASASTPVKEGSLREASCYLDATWGQQYLGARLLATQGLFWPRRTVLAAPGARLPLYRHYGIARPFGVEFPVGFYLFNDSDGCDVDLTIVYGADGYPLPALPLQIINATIELAARAMSAPLAQDFVTGGRLKSEAAGDTEFVYFDDGRASASYGFLNTMLTPVLAQAGQDGWNWA